MRWILSLVFVLICQPAFSQIPNADPNANGAGVANGATQAEANAAIAAASAQYNQMLPTKSLALTGVAALPAWWPTANAVINDPARPFDERFEAWMYATECDMIAMNIILLRAQAADRETAYLFYYGCAVAAYINPSYDLAIQRANEANLAASNADAFYQLIISDVQDIIDLDLMLSLL